MTETPAEQYEAARREHARKRIRLAQVRKLWREARSIDRALAKLGPGVAVVVTPAGWIVDVLEVPGVPRISEQPGGGKP